jgi:hypothetical protein
VSPVAYAGDDLGDLPAFDAITALGGYRLVIIHGEETAPAVASASTISFASVEVSPRGYPRFGMPSIPDRRKRNDNW